MFTEADTVVYGEFKRLFILLWRHKRLKLSD